MHSEGRVGACPELATETPQLRDDGRTLFVHFDEHVPTWQTLLGPGIPAHVLQSLATRRHYEDADSAKDHLVASLLDRDSDELAALSRAWNDAYNLDETGSDPPGVPGLRALRRTVRRDRDRRRWAQARRHPQYRGDRRAIETIRALYSPDPFETVALLADREGRHRYRRAHGRYRRRAPRRRRRERRHRLRQPPPA